MIKKIIKLLIISGLIMLSKPTNKFIYESNDIIPENHLSSLVPKDAFAILDIPEIGLKENLPAYSSVNNNVNKSIEILFPSNMPDKKNSVLILAAHSGNSTVSFFKNLNKLKKNSIALIHYVDNIYEYAVYKVEKQEKNGEIYLTIDNTKNTLILTTCDPKDKSKQIVIYLKMTSKS